MMSTHQNAFSHQGARWRENVMSGRVTSLYVRKISDRSSFGNWLIVETVLGDMMTTWKTCSVSYVSVVNTYRCQLGGLLRWRR